MEEAPVADVEGVATLQPTSEVKAEGDSHVELAVDAPQPQQQQQREDEESAFDEAHVEGGGAEEEAENDEEEDADGDGDEEEGYAAEYRSLLFRVADMETQEDQRARQQNFALRMARREAQLMSRVVRQQQVFLATRASQRTSATTAAGPSGDGDTTRNAAESNFENHLTSSEAVAEVVAADARLLCAAYRVEQAQLRKRQLVEAATQLTSHAQTVQQDLQYTAQLQRKAQAILAQLCEATNIELLSNARLPTAAGEASGKGSSSDEDRAASMRPSSFASASPLTQTWQRHSASLTTLGGTLAKVHTLFRDAGCRAHMAVVAAHLAEVGRHTQGLLREVQTLTHREAELEAALRQCRHTTVEWSVYAAHAQQAREMRDIHSPATVAEMRAMALRKLLLRRRQELQSALTVMLLREAERATQGRHVHDGASPETVGVSCVDASHALFASPAADVTTEKMKALADDCTRREVLRDRLWRELLFLKKCARREFGVAWVAQWEAAAVRQTASAASGTGDGDDGSRDGARRLREALLDNVRATTYDGIARVVGLAAQQRPPPPRRTTPDRVESAADLHAENVDVGVQGDAVRGLEPSPSQSPESSPLPPTVPEAYPLRVRALATLESVQTRVNSLTSLLLENAKHWQCVTDMRVEVECGSGLRDEGWLRTAELLLRRCSASGPGSIASNEEGSGDADEGADDGSGSRRDAASTQSLLLEMEQHLLDSFGAAESEILAEVNAGLAQLHAQCIAPLLRAKREVALLVRLLQLSDEAVMEAHANEMNIKAAAGSTTPCAGGTRTTPALESALKLLCDEAGVAPASSSTTSTSTDAATTDVLDALLSRSRDDATNASTDFPHICLPQPPPHTAVLQAAMAAVSADWHDALQADTAALRQAVTAKHVNLEQYAQYSMADVPALLEKARAEVTALKGQLATHTAQSSRAATLTQEIDAAKQRLHDHTGDERRALQAAVEAAVRENAAVEAEVVFLRACKALRDSETSARQSIGTAEGSERAVVAATVDEVLANARASTPVKDEADVASASVKSEGAPAAAPPHPSLLDASYDEQMKAEETGDGFDEQEAVEQYGEEEEEEQAGDDADAGTYDGEEEEEEGEEEEKGEEGEEVDTDGAVPGEGEDESDFVSSTLYDAPEGVHDDDVGVSVAAAEEDEGHLPPDSDRTNDGSSNDDGQMGASPLNDQSADAAFAEEAGTSSELRDVRGEDDAFSPTARVSAEEEHTSAAASMTTAPRVQDNEDEQTDGTGLQDDDPEEEEKEEAETSSNGGTAAAAAIASPTPIDVVAQEEEEEQQYQRTLSLTNPAAVLPPDTGETNPNEEAQLQSEEVDQVGRGSVLGDATAAGILGGGGAAELSPPPLPPPVLPTPATTAASTSAVLDDNPFYSGFGFDDG